MNHVPTTGQAGGDERRAGGDAEPVAGTGGAFLGLSGAERRAILGGWLVGLAIVGLVMAIDIITRTHNLPQEGLAKPVVDELSSAVVTAVMLFLPVAIILWVRRRSPPLWLAAPVFVVGAAVYPVVHVAAFVAIRKVLYPPIVGGAYDFGRLPREFIYEAGKDVPAFAFACLVFWLVLRWRLDGQTTVGQGPQVIDIRDGARLVRAQAAEVLAVRSAGNYAEFLLADGRRPLMRTSLGALEARLAPLGFVRTHRSWLVNAGRVTGLRPEGSGDYAIELGEVEAPLSRRFPAALKALRA